MITTLDNRTPSEVVWEFNRLRGKPVTVYCMGELNGTTGIVTGASVIGRVVSVQVGTEADPSYTRIPLTGIVGVEVMQP